MKKQKSNRQLAFNKASILELNKESLSIINGGSSNGMTGPEMGRTGSSGSASNTIPRHYIR
jgi:hypothetical protein